MDLIHSDLCGPMSDATLSGFSYFVTFIDDYSWKTWIYFLKTKESDEVLNRFKEFKELVENQTERRIRVLRSENGGEYTSGGFVDFCGGGGIKREFTVPYNLQQNGVVERKNRTIVSAARAMIHDQGLQMYLWAEACGTVVYVQNRSPHRRLGDITPEEAFIGENLEISHLRIFECPVYIHVPREKRTKLDPAWKRGIFAGYSESEKAYRIYIPDQRKMELR